MRYTWIATYTDGAQLSQIQSDGSKNSYENIDQTCLRTFELCDRDGAPVVRVDFQPGERLIWRRRVAMSPGGIEETCHIIGKRRPVDEGLEVSNVICVFESDGRAITADGFDDAHPWLYAPELLEHEM